uniref:Uncharacterized protein n=1 Tax=Meloidogyne hapla TaxID=6305 RepID=A0A1I8B5W7_MELHA
MGEESNMAMSNDQSLNTAKEQQTQSAENNEEVDQEDKIAFPLEKAMLLNFPSENKEQQQEDYIPESAVISSGSLQRRVTFSDLNTIFEAPEDEDQVEDEPSDKELKQEDSIPKIGCTNWGDGKDTEGIEERRKEHIVQLALDQMRIVGQHGVKETTTAEEVSINEDKHPVNLALQPCEQMTKTNDGDNFVSTQQLALKMQFPSQSERFDRTRFLFEHGTGGINTDNDKEDDEEKNKQ